MPLTVNGIGTAICSGRAFVKWGGPADCDGMECLVVLFLPILPYKAVHTFGWEGTNYRAIPIRWSWGLVAATYARRWLWLPPVAAMIAGFIAIGEARRSGPGPAVVIGAAALVVFALTAICYWLLRRADHRAADIRRVLGPHQFGSSDPATWTAGLLGAAKDPKQLFDTASYADAVPKLLADRKFSAAMWAARLAKALEDRVRGEELTGTILDDPDVQDALVIVRKNPAAWPGLMGEKGGPDDEPILDAELV